MDKKQELLRLRAFVQGLPANTYTKNWLVSQMPAIEQAITSDVYPEQLALDAEEWQALRQKQEETARREATVIVDKARKDAVEIRRACVHQVQRAKDTACRVLKEAQQTVDRIILPDVGEE